MATIDYSPEEQAYIQEREAALKQQVATTPEPKAVTKKTTTVKDTNPSTLATVSDVQNTSAAPVDYGSLVSNVVSGYKDVKEKAPSVLESLDTSMPWLKYAAGALGILGAGALAYKAGGGGRPPNPPDDNNNGGRKSPSSIRDRSMIRIDPEMDVSRRMPDGRIEPTFGGPDSNRMVGGLFPADVSTKPTGPTPETPTVPLTTEVGKAPKEMPMVEQGLANKEINAVAEGRKQAVPPPSKSVVDISGLTKEEAGMKKYLTSFYGGGIPGEQAYEKTIEILGARPSYEPGKGGGLTPEQNKLIKDWRKENVQGPKVNLTKDMKSAIRGGAGLAILAAIPGFAEAKNLRQAAGNVAEGLLPIGLTPSELASGTLTEKQLNAYKEAQKLGSPYRSVPPPR
jgi:hypothetical protein